MPDSYRTTGVNVDSRALSRLMEVARETDVYANRREAADDNYEAVIHLLADYFQEEDEL